MRHKKRISDQEVKSQRLQKNQRLIRLLEHRLELKKQAFNQYREKTESKLEQLKQEVQCLMSHVSHGIQVSAPVPSVSVASIPEVAVDDKREKKKNDEEKSSPISTDLSSSSLTGSCDGSYPTPPRTPSPPPLSPYESKSPFCSPANLWGRLFSPSSPSRSPLPFSLFFPSSGVSLDGGTEANGDDQKLFLSR